MTELLTAAGEYERKPHRETNRSTSAWNRNLQKHCLVQFLDPVEDTTRFSSDAWPLHSTIAGVFAFDRQTHGEDFYETIAEQDALTTYTTKRGHFGPNEDVPVMLIERTPELARLHQNIVDFVLSRQGIFKPPHYIGENYCPHITIPDNNVQPDVPIVFDALSLVDMSPNGDATMRQVLATIVLRE